MSNLIEQALTDCDDTDVVVTGHNVLDQTGSVFAKLFPNKAALVIADENTWAVAGEEVVKSLKASGIKVLEPYVFPGKPTLYASYENAIKIRDYIEPFDAIVCSIGSGSLNDLVKRASDELGRRYMNVCTAASMDGYAAFGASLTEKGFKHTMQCRAPQALISDLPTMAAAPQRCTATGLGDLIEKVPAGCDWILADELDIEPIDNEVWDLVQGPLPSAIEDPEGLANGKPEALAGLVEGLIMSGLSMQKYRISSRPASGAGHQFSHVWEMEHLGADWDPPLTHGFKVGLGTICVLALWDNIINIDFASIDIEEAVAKWPSRAELEARIRSLIDEDLVDAALDQTFAKYVDKDELRQRLLLAQEKWPAIQERCRKQLMPAVEVEKILKQVGAIYHPSQIGVDKDRLYKTYLSAQMIRSRYTLPDFLFEFGILEQEVDKLFAPGGFWDQRPW